MKASRSRSRPRPRPGVRRCAICGSTKDLTEHHLGGWHHARYFTIPLCRPHHEAVSVAITRANRDLMQRANNEAERARRARMAAYVFLWFLDEIIYNDKGRINHR